MAKQIVQPNVNIQGRLGWCLEYARKAFGAPIVEATAWQAWTNARAKHQDRDFPNFAVPVWFDYWENGVRYGHVAIRLADGRIFSSPYNYSQPYAVLSSVDQVDQIYGTKYVGWSEDISGVTVVDLSANILPYQRVVAADKVNVRAAPSTSSAVLIQYAKGDVLDFAGFVRGEVIDGNPYWLKSRYRDAYVSVETLEDKGLHDLSDLTPVKPSAPSGSERIVADGGLNVREAPNTTSNILRTLPPNTKVALLGFVRSELVSSNNIWFRIADGYIWSGGTNDTSTKNITDLTPSAPALPTYTFQKMFDFVDEVIPAAEGNFERGNFPASPTKIVWHDFGKSGVNTFQSLVNTFKNGKSEVSARFAITYNEALSKAWLVQFVKEGDRAYHAGPKGNDYESCEIDPKYSDHPAVVARAQQLWKALDDKTGFHLQGIEHNSIMATSCGDDLEVAWYDYTINDKPQTQYDDLDKRVKGLEAIVKSIVDFLSSIFKNFNK